MMEIEAMDEKLVEHVAREYCRLRGLEPDDHVALPHDGGMHMVLHYGPQWRVYEESARHHMMMTEAAAKVGS